MDGSYIEAGMNFLGPIGVALLMPVICSLFVAVFCTYLHYKHK